MYTVPTVRTCSCWSSVERLCLQLSEDNQRLMREKARLEHEKQALARLLEKEREREKYMNDNTVNGMCLWRNQIRQPERDAPTMKTSLVLRIFVCVHACMYMYMQWKHNYDLLPGTHEWVYLYDRNQIPNSICAYPQKNKNVPPYAFSHLLMHVCVHRRCATGHARNAGAAEAHLSGMHVCSRALATYA